MKSLILGDIHVKDKNIDELEDIFQEFYGYDVDEYLLAGDLFHNVRPHPTELDFVTKWMLDFKKKGDVSIVIGNHESISNSISTLSYLQYLGVKLIKHNGVFERNGQNLYIGHHFISEGRAFHQDPRFKVKDLEKNYDASFLGHDHRFHQYAPTVHCMGSVYHTNFKELDYPTPRICMVDTAKTLKMDFYEIQSAYPMYEVDSLKKLKEAPAKTKIRMVFDSLPKFLATVDQLPEFEKKFALFSVRQEYKKEKVTRKVQAERKDFDEIFNDYLQKEENREVVKFIKGIE